MVNIYMKHQKILLHYPTPYKKSHLLKWLFPYLAWSARRGSNPRPYD
jgi:hypothetical protein